MSLTDNLSCEGAARLVRKVEAYWRAVGFSDVSAWSEQSSVPIGVSAHGSIYSVRSNLDYRGLPISATPTDAIRALRINRMIRKRQEVEL